MQEKKWSIKHEKCVECDTTERRHLGRGLCNICYNKRTERKLKNQDTKGVRGSFRPSETYLRTEYIERNRSLSEIAVDCGLTRQRIYQLLRQYEIEVRDKTTARDLALKAGKLKFERTTFDGKQEVVTLGTKTANASFFKIWSPEMAYVLGVIYTDGNLSPGYLRDPNYKTTTPVSRLTIAQKEPELLNKVLHLMGSNASLLYREKRIYPNTISGAAYYFHINNEEIYEDLIGLGLMPKKSLVVRFPRVPAEYIRHFVRGCWDGDGSVYLENGKLRLSYISGSYEFVDQLVKHLFELGVYQTRLRPVRTMQQWDSIMMSRDGIFPLKIYKTNKSRAFYIKINYPVCQRKLFDLFYDAVDESAYLIRKYEKFKQGLGNWDS